MPDKQLEAALKEIGELKATLALKQPDMASARLAAIIQDSDDAIIGKDLNSIITSWNREAEKIFGYSGSEMVGASIMRLIPTDRQGEEEQILGKIRQGENVNHFETLRQTKTGRLIHVSVTASPIKDATGRVVGVSKVARDISERKRVEVSLNLFRTLIDHANDGIEVIDPITGRFLDVNGTACQRLGYQRGELLALSVPDIEATAVDFSSWRKVVEEIRQAGVKTLEGRHKRKDGSVFPVEVSVRYIKLDRDYLIASVRDITARQKLEAQYRQAQKMEGIGQLAGGVAHDFNNILAVIQMQSELLKGGGTLSGEQAEFVDEISVTVRRGAALTRQLLLFSRREVFQPRDLDLGESITQTAKMLMRILGENIQMELRLATRPMFIHADAGMMDQVLMNLTVNARDAMPQGGLLVIETSAVEFDEFALSHSPNARVGSFVCLSVTDSGCGIPPENVTKIFEPFFTTKAVGKGTGLGLATVFGIVQQHQGWINVYSEVNHGTTFRVYVPRLARNSPSQTSQPAQMAFRGGNETLLLAEDDPSLRVSVRKALSQLGYRILEAPTGVKALEVWQENRGEIRLLLTDLVMPDGMSGKDLATRLLKEKPELKVVYMSGYSAEVVGKGFPLKEGVNFLAKPFQASKLAQTIRDSLDRPG